MNKSKYLPLILIGIGVLLTRVLPIETNIASAAAETGSPLAHINYQYQMNDGSSGQGTYWLLPGLRFVDESGRTGYWLFPPTNVPRFILRYDAGMSCDALSIGVFVQPHLYQGSRLCRDGSGVYGIWTGVVVTPLTPWQS